MHAQQQAIYKPAGKKRRLRAQFFFLFGRNKKTYYTDIFKIMQYFFTKKLKNPCSDSLKLLCSDSLNQVLCIMQPSLPHIVQESSRRQETGESVAGLLLLLRPHKPTTSSIIAQALQAPSFAYCCLCCTLWLSSVLLLYQFCLKLTYRSNLASHNSSYYVYWLFSLIRSKKRQTKAKKARRQDNYLPAVSRDQ